MKDKVLFTLSIKKRHVLVLLFLVIGGLLAYSDYFREYMTLPQSAAVLLPEAEIDLNNKKILILTPHCDDEVLGTGGIIKRSVSSGSEVKVIMVTDCNKHSNGSIREKESIEALATLGLTKSIHFWRFKEGGDQSENDTARLEDKIIENINSFNPDYIFVPHPRDTHKDHSWVGKTYKQIKSEMIDDEKTFYYLIHYNFLKFPSPAGLNPDAYLTPPVKLILPNRSWYKFSITPEEEQLKEEAILKYKSQLKITKPVLNRLLFDFVRRNELFMMEEND